MFKLILVTLAIMAYVQVGLAASNVILKQTSDQQQVQKICNGATGPFTLQCFSRTGVVVRQATVMFVFKSDSNKNCDAVVVRNVSEPIQNLQRYCDQARPNSLCTLDSSYVKSVFTVQETANDQYYPVRLEIRFDCLESQYNGVSSSYKLSLYSMIISLAFFTITKLF